MIFWGEPGATRAREVAQDLIDTPTITLCQQNRPLSCPGCLHPARPIALFYMALGIPLTRQKQAVLTDRLPHPATTCRKGKELIRRLRAGRCEWCEQRADVQAHHVRRLADLDKPGGPRQPEWAKIMVKRRRKALVVCADCHDEIHTGQCAGKLTQQSLESYVR